MASISLEGPEGNFGSTAIFGAASASADSAYELQTIAGHTPFILAHCSAELRYIFVTDSYARLFNRQADEIKDRYLVEIMGEKEFRAILPHIERVLQGERVEFEARMHFGETGDRFLRAVYTPEKDPRGRTKGFIASITDISALRAIEEKNRSALILGRIGSWEVDFVKSVRTWTPEGMALFGINLTDGLGRVGGETDEFRQAMHPEDRHLLAQFHGLANKRDSFPAEYRIVKADGQIRWLSGYGRALDRQSDGSAHHLINVATDITERKAADAHQRFLLQELSHRTKNLLSIVQAIADQTLRTCSDLKQFQNRFDGRLRGLAASNTLLAHGDQLGTSLRALIELQLAPFIDATSPQVDLHGPALDLTPEATQAIGLALHELATNAVKHGALSVQHGKVSISWNVDQAGSAKQLALNWQELGGPPVTAPKRKGFGHVVMKRMIEQAVRGKVELIFAPGGLRWSLKAPGSVFLR